MLRRLLIAGAGVHGLFLKFQNLRVTGVGKGCGAGFLIEVIDDGRADFHPVKERPLIDIGQQSVQGDQQTRKNCNAAQQFRQGCRLLHLAQHHRGNEQLAQIQPQLDGGIQ